MALKTQTRGPWAGGYTSSVPAFMAREDQLWGQQSGSDNVLGDTSIIISSRNCFIDPFTGGVSKRAGCAIVGDTITTSPSRRETDGLLSAKWSAKARKFIALDSPSMSDGYPTRAVLYGEDINAGFPTTDSGFPGTLYMRTTNGGVSAPNRQLLEEFGTTHYAGTQNGAHDQDDFKLRMVPIWIESGDGVYNRGAYTGTGNNDPFMQQYMTCGSRSVVQTQNWMYFPNLRATPWRWNKRFNDAINSGSEVLRGFPTGPFSPLYPPTIAGTTTTNDAAWEEGDTFYVSVMFRFEDGSVSRPFIPRAANSVLSSGLGRVTLGTAGGTNKYLFLTWSKIPIGPEGTVERILLRTPKQKLTAATDTITVEPLDLRVVGVLKNNTQTSYLDYKGDDDALVEDDDNVRIDLVCPRRARYYGTGDQRVLASYTLPNTAAIMLAPTGAVASRDMNLPDTEENGIYDTSAFLVRITSTQLELHASTGGAPNAATNYVAFTFASYTTIESLVDAINATTTSSFCKQWAAQLAPGVDGTMPSTSLTLTSFDVANCTATGTALATSSGTFASVGVGMKVKGTGVTNGTYVVSKASNTGLTLSSAATSSNVTLTFYQETGDNGIVDGGSLTTVGYMRAFACTFPLLLHMKPSAFPKYDQPDKTSVFYTSASPGALSSGTSLAPNSWLSGNKLTVHSSPNQKMQRTCMGIVDIEGAAIVAYTDGIKMFANRRGGNTGEDFDYRLFDINDSRGCISYLSLVSGNGWAAYGTTEGIVVTDKSGREFTISGDVFNPSDNKGDPAYEIATSAASAAKDGDDQYLSCAVMGSRLAVAFRPNPSLSVDPRVLYYDFSPGVEASGVEELLNPESKRPYVWSPPAIYNSPDNLNAIGAMGSLWNASGRSDYICYDSNQGTGDGRIDQVNTGTDDNGVAFVSYAMPSPFLGGDFSTISPQNLDVTHLTISGSGLIYLANNQVPTFNASLARTLNVDSLRTQFQKQVVPIAQGQRGRTDMLWTQWRVSTGTSNRIWRIVLQYDENPLDTGQQDLA